jgi:hypothetical protein
MTEIIELAPDQAGEWAQFLEASNNGTLFHNLDFLAYHPPGRFDDVRHLVFRGEDGRAVALLPAAVVTGADGRRVLKSPYGASVGGLVLPIEQGMATTLDLVGRLKAYAESEGLDGIEVRLPPNFYLRRPDDHQGFALAAHGFQLSRRWISSVVPVPEDPDAFLAQCRSRRARYIRGELRRGVTPREVGVDRVDDFYPILLADRAKNQAVPTHSRDEVQDLLTRLPGRVRLFLCEDGGRALAGLLLFMLTPTVAYTFYLCQDDPTGQSRANAVLLAHVAQQMAGEGIRHLDMGPTSFDDMTLNRGLAFFKEEFGARGFCRDAWRWDRYP